MASADIVDVNEMNFEYDVLSYLQNSGDRGLLGGVVPSLQAAQPHARVAGK